MTHFYELHYILYTRYTYNHMVPIVHLVFSCFFLVAVIFFLLHTLLYVVVTCSFSCLIRPFTLKYHVLYLMILVVNDSQVIGVILRLSGISSVACLVFWFLFIVFF